MRKCMNRTGLIVALAIVAGVVFGLYPELDLRVAQHYHDYIDKSRNAFAWRIYPPMMRARDISLWVTTVLVLPAVVALVIKILLPRRKLLVSGRAIVFLIATLVLAPGLLVNILLKDHWGRPRPIDVTRIRRPSSISSPGGIRAAIVPTTARSCPATWPARSGRLRRRHWRRRNGGRLPMARRLRLAPPWPHFA